MELCACECGRDAFHPCAECKKEFAPECVKMSFGGIAMCRGCIENSEQLPEIVKPELVWLQCCKWEAPEQ